MGTIIAFPAITSPRTDSTITPRSGMGQIVILPVVRIERQSEDTTGGSGPEEGAAPGRRRKRRVRS